MLEQRMESAQNFIKSVRKMSNSKKESDEYYAALSESLSLYKAIRTDNDILNFSAAMLAEKHYEPALLVARIHQHLFP